MTTPADQARRDRDAALNRVITTHLADYIGIGHLGPVLHHLRHSLGPFLAPPADAVAAIRAAAALTEREVQVLQGMAAGDSNAAIGRRLYISEATVKTHNRRLFRKLGARDRAHAVSIAYRRGLLS